MEKFKILISSSAEKRLKRVPKKNIRKIISLIQSLSTDPYPQGCRKLHSEGQIYRVRQGRYRVIYEIIKKKLCVLLLKIGHRKDIYKSF